MRTSVLDRIETRLDKNSGDCWVWLGCKDSKGYGTISCDGIQKKVHRVVYELLVGPIPAGLCLDHLCRVKACCNPQHLEPVTNRENTLRGNTWGSGWRRHMTHCLQGHPFDERNTYITSRGARQCKACSRSRKGLTGLGQGTWQKSRTHCPAGHEYTPENTRLNRFGHRKCRVCERVRDKGRKR